MIVYILHRLLSMGLSLFGVSLLVFFMVHLIPGDAALAILGERATEEALTELRRQMGLDQPLYKQYGVFLWDLIHFDLGRSFKTNQPVIDEILRKFPATVELTLAAMIFSIFFWHRGRDYRCCQSREVLGLHDDVRIIGRDLNANLLARVDAYSAACLYLPDFPQLTTA